MPDAKEKWRDYEQHLSEKLKELYFKDSYKKLREFIKSECQNDVIFAVRKDEIHIYYLGGRILKITKAYDYLKLAIDLKYAKVRKGSDELNEYGEILNKLNNTSYRDEKVIDLWIEHWGKLKECMNKYRAWAHNDERQLQQQLELANRDFNGDVVVIDNEYGVRKECKIGSKLCKVDLVALYRDNGKYKICLIELKYGDGSINGPAGIDSHINDFKTFLEVRRLDIIKSVNNLIEYKRANNSLYNVPRDIMLGEDTKICASILCYNLKPENKKIVADSINKHKQEVDFDLYRNLELKIDIHEELKIDSYRLTKKDILGK